MRFFWRVFQRRHEAHQLMEESRERKARETERRVQTKLRADRQAQALLFILSELRGAMDPLIASQVYNNRFCPLISRLPEELLLRICDFLYNDVAAQLCLRITSRMFFRLTNSELTHLWVGTTVLIRGEAFYIHDALRLRYRQLLQRDGRCSDCKRWNDAHKPQLSDDCKFQQLCRGSSPRDKVYCIACQSLHDMCQFPQQSLKDQTRRRCLGQQGSVQLCAHIQITWASIKAHIDDWRQQRHGKEDWQVCLDNFVIECHNISHATDCTVSATPTWPRARLTTGSRHSDIVVLNLEWKPHARVDALALTADGRIPAPELRSIFRRLRSLRPADQLYPVYYPGFLPEMAFFGPSSYFGRLVYYQTGDYHEIERPSPFPLNSPYPSPLWNHTLGRGRNGKKLDIRFHCRSDAISDAISTQCLVTSYEKDIVICETASFTDPSIKIIPTDHWLHAMDTGSYPHPRGVSVRPQCKDVKCVNYYQKRKDFYSCLAWWPMPNSER